MTAESRSTQLSKPATSNADLDANAFLYGSNAGFIEGLYAQYLNDADSVDGTWRAFFDALGEKGLSAAQLGRGPHWQRRFAPGFEDGELIEALTGGAFTNGVPLSAPFSETPAADGHAISQASIRAI